VQLQRDDVVQMIKKVEPEGFLLCYCEGVVPAKYIVEEYPDEDALREDPEFIECSYAKCEVKYFHRKCIQEFNPERSSRWYCGECDVAMERVARKEVMFLQGKGDGEVEIIEPYQGFCTDCRKRPMFPSPGEQSTEEEMEEVE
jgi:hypothetical protein